MIRIPTDRFPTHAGEMLLEEFPVPTGITQREMKKSDSRRAQDETEAAQ
jgi:plasmid maintenance system antidote protein VapI